MTDIPKWLEVMRSITGTQEYSGAADNPKIMGWVDAIAKAYPDMQSYCDGYTGDDIAWCGLTVAYCMTMAGIRPVFGPTDTDRWMWAQAWAGDEKNFKPVGRPTPGTIVVMTRSGGGHVTLFEEWDDDMLLCRGGNQSDEVNLSSYDPETVIHYVWPVAAGDQPQIPVEDRPMLEEGDSGPDVFDLQSMIPNFTDTIDGDFGPATKENVVSYQYTRGLEVDGVVGQETWQALYDNKAPIPPPAPPPGALTAKQQSDIRNIAKTSHIAKYSWPDRGVAPSGYTQGMALAFAQDCVRLKARHPTVIEMAKARTNSDKDALNVYKDEYHQMGMSNERPGIDTLRHLYVMMLSSGMLESSGEHCCGRDQSASNVSSDTCEAGLFQTSYNASNASDPEFDDTMDEFMANHAMCYLEAFAENVSCSESDWENYGSGRGFQFQQLCKNCPMFAVETHGLTLRNLCNHYGPCNRGEYVLKTDADSMFQDVQDYIEGQSVVA
jgi:uncharacterized protein (TIGR02594 family)